MRANRISLASSFFARTALSSLLMGPAQHDVIEHLDDGIEGMRGEILFHQVQEKAGRNLSDPRPAILSLLNRNRTSLQVFAPLSKERAWEASAAENMCSAAISFDDALKPRRNISSIKPLKTWNSL